MHMYYIHVVCMFIKYVSQQLYVLTQCTCMNIYEDNLLGVCPPPLSISAKMDLLYAISMNSKSTT